jgi:aminoglycoside 6'-N-acetyltransferase
MAVAPFRPMDGTETPAATLATDGDLSLRRLRDDPADYALIVRWRAMPHVHEWWDPDDPAPDLDEVLRHYRPTTQPGHATTGCVIQLGSDPVGYLQFYRWADWTHEPPGRDESDIPLAEDPWGIDIYIGEPEVVGRGIGTRAVSLACRYLQEAHGARAVMLMTDVDNVRAQAAYERAGFRKLRQVLDTDTRGGERTWCWLMRWDGQPDGAKSIGPA